MIKKLLLLLAVVMCVGQARAVSPLTTWESDSVSAALAGVWGDYFAKRGSMSDAPSKAAYLAGLKAALSAADSTAAYAEGVESGVLVNTRLHQIEQMGNMKIDRARFCKK